MKTKALPVAAALVALIVGIVIGSALSNDSDGYSDAEYQAMKASYESRIDSERADRIAAESAAADAEAGARDSEDRGEAADAEPASDTIPGSGTYEVGVDVKAGTYKNDGPSNDAYCVAYTSKKPADLGSYIRGSNSQGPGVIEIKAGEYFSTEFCQDWTRQ